MAISQIGNIAHINQNVNLNSQIQANALNQANIQSAMNIQEFNSKIENQIEVRPTQGVESINKDSTQNKKDTNKPQNKKKENKKPHINNYGRDNVYLLDIEV